MDFNDTKEEAKFRKNVEIGLKKMPPIKKIQHPKMMTLQIKIK